MTLGINTNIASLSAQRALANTQSDSATAMQRLSTGLRVNSAKDDAAGLAVSNALTSQIKGLNQANRNANDAVSMLQTAEGGLQAVTDSLQRMRELAVQAASDSISDIERDYLDVEFQQLITEIDRVVNSSSYNSVQLLDGTNGAMTFQVGANNSATNDRIQVTIADSNTSALGAVATTATLTGTAMTGSITSGDVTINGKNIGAVTVTGSTSLAANTKSAIESADSAVTATVGASSFSMGTFAALSSDEADASKYTYQLTVEGVDIFTAAHDLGNSADLTAVEFDAAIDDQNAALAAVGVTYTGTVGSGNLVFSKADGSNLDVVQVITDTDGDAAISGAGFSNLGVAEGTTTKAAYGSVTLTSSAAITVAGTAAAKAGFHADNLSATAAGTAVSALDVQDTANSQTAIASLDSALSTINSTRASIGSYQSAFDTMISNLSISAENASAARSRVMDADFAQESAALAKNQVLQQAGISVLAQANAMPQQVLALLQ
jgi:flagellin